MGSHQEEFHHNSLLVHESNIYTGSLHGTLRVRFIYLFSRRRERSSHAAQIFKVQTSPVEDLLMEKQLDAPILQMASVKLTSSTSLAILHPRKIVAYEIVKDDSDETSLRLKRIFSSNHEDHFTSYNMVVGHFGHNDKTQGICVQSMDGRLAFYGTFSLTHLRTLPHTHLLTYPPTHIYIYR